MLHAFVAASVMLLLATAGAVIVATLAAAGDRIRAALAYGMGARCGAAVLRGAPEISFRTANLANLCERRDAFSRPAASVRRAPALRAAA